MPGRSYRLVRGRRVLAAGDAPADDVYAALVLQSPGVYTFSLGGTAALELVDTGGSPRTFSAVAAGTSAGSARLRATVRGANTYVALR